MPALKENELSTKRSLLQNVLRIAIFFSLLWSSIQLLYLKDRNVFVPFGFIFSFGFYFVYTGFCAAILGSLRQKYIKGTIAFLLAQFYLHPFFQIFYFQTYKTYLEQQNLSLLMREPLFLWKILTVEFSLLRLSNFILAGILVAYYLLNYLRVQPKDYLFWFRKKWLWVFTAVVFALQVKWCLNHDRSQLWIRPFYIFWLLLFGSVLTQAFRQGNFKKLAAGFGLAFIALMFIFNIYIQQTKNWLFFDVGYYRSLFGAYFVSTAFKDMQQNQDAVVRWQNLPPVDLGYNILIILNDSQRWDFSSVANPPVVTDQELDFFYKKSYVFEFPVSPANFTDTALPSILTGFSSDKDVTFIKSNLVLWDYFSKTAQSFFISSQDINWSKLNLLYHSVSGNKVWSSVLDTDYKGIPEDISDHVSFDYIKDYLGQLKRNYVGVWQTYAAHFPYTAESAFKTHLPCDLTRKTGTENLKNCYLNGLSYSAHIRAELLRGIDLENTVVILTSDHGEGFGEHGIFFHGIDYHQEMVKVPFVIYIPDRLKKMIPADNLKNLQANTKKVVSLLDIMPTLLNLSEFTSGKKMVSDLNYFSGKSLFSQWDHRTVFSSHCFPQYRCYSRDILFADDNYYLIYRPTENNFQVYSTWEDLKQERSLDQKALDQSKLKLLVNEAAIIHPSGAAIKSVLGL